MAATEPQLESIIRYLDNELSPTEEIRFVKELAANPELQQAFDIALMLREHNQRDEVNEVLNQERDIRFERADDFLKRTETIISTPLKNEAKRPPPITPVITLWSRKKIASIAAAVIIIAASIFYFTKLDRDKPYAVNNGKQRNEKNTGLPKQDTSLNLPPLKDTSSVIMNDNYLAEISSSKYNRYKNTADDPVQVSLYYDLYERKQYTEVLKATQADYAVKGGGNEQELSDQYMFFYKALSYIETGKPLKGIGLLKTVIKKSSSGQSIFYQTQHYLLLAYMQLNDRKNTEVMLSAILNNVNNPNRKTALEISNLIKQDDR